MSEDTEIRANEWHTMTLHQLNAERDKIVGKMSLLTQISGKAGNPTVYGLYKALEHALTVVSGLINERSQK